jgi:hypothetical protein
MRSSRATAVAGVSPDALRRLAEPSRRCRTAVAAGLALVVAVTATAGATGRDSSGATHAPRFSDYPAGAAYRGTPAAPDFKRNPAAEPFAAELREGVRRGPNFAGYLRVVEWSCGVSCRRWMIVNTKTGRVQDSPEPAFSLDYQLNSLLLVVNTVGRFTAADPPAGVPIANYYVWRNDRLQLIDTRVLRPTR